MSQCGQVHITGSPGTHQPAVQGAINDGFAKFTEALFVAEQQARQAVELRSKVQQEIAHREKAAKDAELRNLAIRCPYLPLTLSASWHMVCSGLLGLPTSTLLRYDLCWAALRKA